MCVVYCWEGRLAKIGLVTSYKGHGECWGTKKYLRVSVTEDLCFLVCLSVSESVHPKNIVNTISQKPMKEISPNFGHKCI